MYEISTLGDGRICVVVGVFWQTIHELVVVGMRNILYHSGFVVDVYFENLSFFAGVSVGKYGVRFWNDCCHFGLPRAGGFDPMDRRFVDYGRMLFSGKLICWH